MNRLFSCTCVAFSSTPAAGPAIWHYDAERDMNTIRGGVTLRWVIWSESCHRVQRCCIPCCCVSAHGQVTSALAAIRNQNADLVLSDTAHSQAMSQCSDDRGGEAGWSGLEQVEAGRNRLKRVGAGWSVVGGCTFSAGR